eukprot:scaffold3683_cov118-Isochrysis_galbana.AAC.6
MRACLDVDTSDRHMEQPCQVLHHQRLDLMAVVLEVHARLLTDQSHIHVAHTVAAADLPGNRMQDGCEHAFGPTRQLVGSSGLSSGADMPGCCTMRLYASSMKISEFAPRRRGSLSGKSWPMSGIERAPRIASTTEWYTTSPSEWATQPSSKSGASEPSNETPEMTTGWPASSRDAIRWMS